MTALPKISVIIPFYNCEYVDQAIGSVLMQNYRNLEIIVVDDGSNAEQHRIMPFRSRIRYFYKTNGGTASALNFGISQATGEYFAWLSADDRYLPGKLERQLAFMRQKGALASFTAFYFMNAAGQRVSDAIRCSFANKLEFYRTMLSGCPVNGCTVMLHMSIFKKIGVFDSQRKYTHDYDFWLRMLPHFDFHYFDEPLLDYRVHEKMGTLAHKNEIDPDIKLVQNLHLASITNLIRSEGGN